MTKEDRERKKLQKQEEKNKRRLEEYYEKCQRKSEKIQYQKYVLNEKCNLDKIQDAKKSVIKHRAWICVLIGIVLLLLMILGTAIVEICITNETAKTVVLTSLNGISCVISMVIGIGVSTLALDFFAYVQYTRERIKEVMLGKDYIETLADSEKEKLIKRLEQSLYFDRGNVLDNSLYANIKQKIIPLLTQEYIREYDINIDCYVNEKQGYIRKKTFRRMTIVALNDTSEFRIPVSVYLTKLNGEADNNNEGNIVEENGVDSSEYVLESCVFNREDITAEVKRAIKPEPTRLGEVPTIENVKYKVDYKVKLEKGINTLEIRTQTKVPIHDNTYSHTISDACQRYNVKFNMLSPDYMVLGFGFALEEKNGERVVKQTRYDSSFEINFTEWALPGDGCVFVINKKKILDDKEENID